MNSNLHKPTVGPIIGHTTSSHTRIFLRGKSQRNALVFAGLRYRRRGETHWSRGIFSQLTEQRDMCEVITLNQLAADTEYEYQAGWFSPMSPVHTVETIQELPLQWPRDIYRFCTPSDSTTVPRGYIVGSCRYLRMTAGLASLPHLGDRIFASINHLAQHRAAPVNAVVMTGDQVYIDDLNLIAPDRDFSIGWTIESFSERLVRAAAGGGGVAPGRWPCPSGLECTTAAMQAKGCISRTCPT